jgi:hypothetical protein
MSDRAWGRYEEQICNLDSSGRSLAAPRDCLLRDKHRRLIVAGCKHRDYLHGSEGLGQKAANTGTSNLSTRNSIHLSSWNRCSSYGFIVR